MYGIAITYAVASLFLLGGFAYITFKMTYKNKTLTTCKARYIKIIFRKLSQLLV